MLQVLLELTILSDHRQDKDSHTSFHNTHTGEREVPKHGERDAYLPQLLHGCRHTIHCPGRMHVFSDLAKKHK